MTARGNSCVLPLVGEMFCVAGVTHEILARLCLVHVGVCVFVEEDASLFSWEATLCTRDAEIDYHNKRRRGLICDTFKNQGPIARSSAIIATSSP